jgi:hypothetical protein
MPLHVVYPIGFSYEHENWTRFLIQQEFGSSYFHSNVKNVVRDEFPILLGREYATVRDRFCNDLAEKFREYDNRLKNTVDLQVNKLVNDNAQFTMLKSSIERRFEQNSQIYVDNKFKSLENQIKALEKRQSESNVFWGLSLLVAIGATSILCKQ